MTTILCACGQPAVAIDPGQAPVRASVGGLFDDPIPLLHGRPVSGRCLACWPVVVDVSHAATAPGHTDLMVTPESLDAWLADNPPPDA